MVAVMAPMVAATVDEYALRHNLRRVRKLAPKSAIMAIIKANGYGHGLLTVATALKEADGFGVARLEEALQLRNTGVTKPVLLLQGFACKEDLLTLSHYQIDTTVHTAEQLELLERLKLPRSVRVWLKIDTGLHRLGVSWQEAEIFYHRLSACANSLKPLGLLSHFSQAEQQNSSYTTLQISRFDRFVAHKAGLQSLAGSSAILCCPQAHRDWVRPGIMLYGISPLLSTTAAALDLQPAMTLKSRLIAVRVCKIGEPVGYHGLWCSARDTCLGVVAIGYGDGYPHNAPYGTPIVINGRQVPLVGRVSMDLLTVDLGPGAQDKIGDSAILWGEGLPIEQVAAHIGVSGYQLVAQLTARVARFSAAEAVDA